MVSISRNGIAILIQVKRSLVRWKALFKRFQMNAKSFDLDMYCFNYSTGTAAAPIRTVTYTALCIALLSVEPLLVTAAPPTALLPGPSGG